MTQGRGQTATTDCSLGLCLLASISARLHSFSLQHPSRRKEARSVPQLLGPSPNWLCHWLTGSSQPP